VATQYYEVVKIKGEFCLRIRATKQPVAWSAKDDAAWKSYVREAKEAVGDPVA
jgi:hypothetical protein